MAYALKHISDDCKDSMRLQMKDAFNKATYTFVRIYKDKKPKV